MCNCIEITYLIGSQLLNAALLSAAMLTSKPPAPSSLGLTTMNQFSACEKYSALLHCASPAYNTTLRHQRIYGVYIFNMYGAS